jgi:hypothetical protein
MIPGPENPEWRNPQHDALVQLLLHLMDDCLDRLSMTR